MKIKLFIHHPTIMNYRFNFFKKLDEIYDLTLFLKQSSNLSQQFLNVKISKKNKINTSPVQIIPFMDLMTIIKNIRKTDVIVSSFSNDLYTILLRILSYIYKKKLITWEEGRDKPDNLIQYLKWKFYQFTLIYSDAIFTMGNTHKETFLKMGIPEKKIFTSNEYPSKNYGEINKKKIKLPFDINKKIILYLGRLEFIKGIQYLIDGFSMINDNQDFVLLIVGEGKDENRLKSHVINNRYDNIYFLGPIFDENEKANIFSISHIGVIPSIKTIDGNSEGGPLVILEYLSTGLPIIGSDKLGSSNNFIIDGFNGYTVPQKKSEAIKDAILKLDYDIQSGNISKKKIIEFFLTIPNHSNQVDVLNEAINYVLDK